MSIVYLEIVRYSSEFCFKKFVPLLTYLVSLNYTMHQKWKKLINVENPSSNLHMLRFTKLMKNKGRMQFHFILDETQVFLNKMNETNLTKKMAEMLKR